MTPDSGVNNSNSDASNKSNKNNASNVSNNRRSSSNEVGKRLSGHRGGSDYAR